MQAQLLELQALPELDVLGERYRVDAAGATRECREGVGLARSVRGVEILTYRRARALLADERLISTNREYYLAQNASELVLDYIDRGLLAWINGTRHRVIRGVLTRGQKFSMRQINECRPMMRRQADQLIDTFIDDGHVDLAAQFSLRYPMAVMADLIGVVPSDIPLFADAVTRLADLGAVPLEPAIPGIEQSIVELSAYISDLLESRRRNPRDDLLTGFVAACAAQDDVSERDLVLNVINLLVGGHDTTRFQLVNCVRRLVEIPGAWESLAGDLDFAGAAIEESLRFDPSLRWAQRTPTEDVVDGGILFPTELPLTINVMAANRDPAQFDDPDRFQPNRENGGKVLTFGRGAHVCLGNSLARVEMQEALGRLSARLGELEIDGPVTESGAADVIGGTASLPLRFSSLRCPA
jgi:cytochrome P450